MAIYRDLGLTARLCWFDVSWKLVVLVETASQSAVMNVGFWHIADSLSRRRMSAIGGVKGDIVRRAPLMAIYQYTPLEERYGSA